MQSEARRVHRTTPHGSTSTRRCAGPARGQRGAGVSGAALQQHRLAREPPTRPFYLVDNVTGSSGGFLTAALCMRALSRVACGEVWLGHKTTGISWRSLPPPRVSFQSRPSLAAAAPLSTPAPRPPSPRGLGLDLRQHQTLIAECSVGRRKIRALAFG